MRFFDIKTEPSKCIRTMHENVKQFNLEVSRYILREEKYSYGQVMEIFGKRSMEKIKYDLPNFDSLFGDIF